MVDILRYPAKESDRSEKFEFPTGGSITIAPEAGKHLTVKDAVFMLEDLKVHLLIMMRG